MLRKKRKSRTKIMLKKIKQASVICLPEELIVEIMLRLPAKALLRFRCINKSRRSLIANPDFIREHLNRSRSGASRYLVLNLLKVSFGLTSADDNYKSLSIVTPPQLDLWASHVVGSENGLVCLHQNNIHGIHLWNPSLRQFKTLPYLKPSYEEERYSVVVKFGFHQVSVGVDDCKVIKMSYLRHPSIRSLAQVDVYSLNRNSWKSIGGYSLNRNSWKSIGGYSLNRNSWNSIGGHRLPSDFLCRHGHGNQVVVNGRIHWMGCFEIPKNEHVLGYFDMNEEVFGVIPLPDQAPLKCFLLDGCLCVILKVDSLIQVWVMKEDGVLRSWTKLYVINRSSLGITEHPIGFTINGEILIFGRKRRYKPQKLISYDPRNDKVKTISTRFDGYPFVYTESLISVFSTVQ